MYIVISACILKTKMAVRIIKLLSQTRLELTTENKPKFFRKASLDNHDVLLLKERIREYSANLIQIRKTEFSEN